MKHLKLFENFEIDEPLPHGEPLNHIQLKLIEKYKMIICPEYIQTDDNYYYVHDYRCEKIKDLPLTYIHGLCSKFKIKNYKINEDYSIDVDGNVNFWEGLTKIPLKFNKVSGSFDCHDNKLTTLEGSPKYVGENFRCHHNKLTTLDGGPKLVGKGFNCSFNNLTTLQGSPKEVGGFFNCESNKLTTLDGGPDVVGANLHCKDNPLTSRGYKGIVKGNIRYK